MARLSSRWQDLRLLYGDTRSMCRFSLLVVNDDSRAEDTPQAIDRLQAVAGNGHICVTSVLETDELLLLVTRRLMMGGIFWQRKACRKKCKYGEQSVKVVTAPEGQEVTRSAARVLLPATLTACLVFARLLLL